jgi:hypothetical protein
MRYMIMIKANEETEAGVPPSPELIGEMSKFNEELVNAGVLLDAGGLQPSSQGARIAFTANDSRVIDGPFAETKELIAGYWVLQVKSRDEAIAWARRCPNPHGSEFELEVRKMFEMDDFGGPTDAVS